MKIGFAGTHQTADTGREKGLGLFHSQQLGRQGEAVAPSSFAPLTTRALVLDRDGSSLLALSFLPLAVIGVGPAVPAAERPVGAITSDTLARAAGSPPAVQAHAVKATLVLALVWKKTG